MGSVAKMITQFVDHTEYVRLSLSDAYNYQDAMRCFVELSLRAHRLDHRRILLDIRRLGGMVSIIEKHLFGIALSKIKPGLRISILCTPKQAESDDHLETVLINRGATVKGFTDEAGAVEWIRESRS